jgi:hypothetical protein
MHGIRPKSAKNIAARWNLSGSGSGCGAATNMNHGDRDYPVQALKNQCGVSHGVPSNSFLWSKSASTVSYFCSLNEPSTCDSNDIIQAAAVTTADCGWYNLGWESFNGGRNRGYTIRYNNAAACFCFC